MRAALALAFLAFVLPARAAQFAIVDGLDGRPAVRIWGDLEIDDARKFAEFGVAHERVYSIVLSGEGGAILPAVRIGAFARSMGLQTVVSAGENCASACALIWAGGARRTLEPGAKVGFHGAFTMVDGAPQPSGAGNALVGAYLARLGYPDDAVVYMTDQPPTGMAWLDLKSAVALRMPYDVASPLARPPVPGKPLPKLPVSQAILPATGPAIPPE